MAFTIRVNGSIHSVDVDGDTPLLWVLRDVLGMTGTKFGCGRALCGACTVHLNGTATRSCITSVAKRRQATDHHDRSNRGDTGRNERFSRPGLSSEVPQCGYCQSGQIMSAAALRAKTPSPSDADIDAAMSGNICRCGTYVRIREGIKRAAHGVRTTRRGPDMTSQANGRSR